MKTILHVLVLTSTLVLSLSCRTAERLLDEGRYDELLSLAQRKMTGKELKDEKYVLLAEEAFAKITDRDMDRIERLKLSNRAQDWEEIIDIADRMSYRQDRLLPFLPLVAENGYQAKFTFVKTEEIIQFAKGEVVDLLYDEGLRFLSNGRAGNKSDAQTAYHRFGKVLSYKVDYRDAIELRDEARDLGIQRVLLTVDNKARHFMPGYVANILDESITASDAFWTQYYTAAGDNIEIDFVAKLVVNSVDVGPEVIREERIPRNKKIQDGWEYVLDANGNVAKDSLGNDIKRTKYTEVHATILKTHQEKVAFLTGLVVLEGEHGGTLESHPVQLESRFYHQAQSFFGDERALNQDERFHIGLVPFPDDAAMMLEVAELVRPAVSNELQRSRYL